MPAHVITVLQRKQEASDWSILSIRQYDPRLDGNRHVLGAAMLDSISDTHPHLIKASTIVAIVHGVPPMMESIANSTTGRSLHTLGYPLM